MRICNTTLGLGLVHEQTISVLDVSWQFIDDVLAEGNLDALSNCPVKQELALDDASLRPLVSGRGQFVIAGLNYRAHCEEIGRPVPEKLVFGTAPGSATNAAGVNVIIPAVAPTEVDYEGEVGVLIGKPARSIAAAEAWDVVAGLMPLNDVSARDVQSQGNPLEAVSKAKGFPTFKPHGPVLATPDEFADPNDIALTTHVNGELRQSGRTSDMVFDIASIIEVVSARIALSPGDVICTGTPGGVAHGGKYPYLVDGDTVEISLDDLPVLRSRFVNE